MPQGTVELVSQAEYARHRGCTEGAVRRAVRDGRIALIDGKIDPVAADAQWSRNTRPRVQVRNSPPEAEPSTLAVAEAQGDRVTYDEARRRQAVAEALMAERAERVQAGELIEVQAVRHAHGRRLAALRESLLQIPARLAPVVAAETDQARCHDIMQRELHGVLRQVSGQVDPS